MSGLVAGLVTAFSGRGAVLEWSEVWDGNTATSPQRLTLTELPDVVSAAERLNIFASDTQMSSMIRLDLPSGVEIFAELALTGQGMSDGHTVLTDGPVKIRLDGSVARRGGLLVSGEPTTASPYGFRASWYDWEEWLRLLCRPTPERQLVSHLAVYDEVGWAPPVFCYAMFHASPGEFLDDLRRIWFSFVDPWIRYGAYDASWEPIHAGRSAELGQTIRDEQSRLLRIYDRIDPSGELRLFVTSLTEQEVDRAVANGVGLTNADFGELLASRSREIRYLPIAEGGLLFTHPSNCLYPAYQALWEALR